MDDYRELFKREFDRLNYLYAKANTISKKKKIAYDLIFFEDMYNGLNEEKIVFPWKYDTDLINIRIDMVNDFIRNVLKEQNILLSVAERSFEIFLEEDFSVYKYYGKRFHRMSEVVIQKNIGKFYKEIDDELVERFRNKLNNVELFVNNNIEFYDGLTFPIESVDKNIIFFKSGEDMCVDDARILVHEMGHDFEFDNLKRTGVDAMWSKLSKTPYVEVASSFFEYAFINYLIDNNIYVDDAKMVKARFLNQMLYFLSYILIIGEINHLNIDYDFTIKIDREEVVSYGDSLLEKMNSSDELYNIGDKLNFRSSFIYGMGRLLAVYLYDSYKNSDKDFLKKFRQVLIKYKDEGIKAFSDLGITDEVLLNGDVLRKTLRNDK